MTAMPPNGMIILSPLKMDTGTKILIKIQPLSTDGAILIKMY